MAKPNFSKVEGLLTKRLEEMAIEKLRNLADKATAMGDSGQAKGAQERIASTEQEKDRKNWITSIKRDMEILHSKDKGILKSLGVNRKELLGFLDKPDEIDEKGWEFIHSLFEKLGQFKVEYLKEIGDTDESLVEAERVKHINKRFNVNDKWLPLH